LNAPPDAGEPAIWPVFCAAGRGIVTGADGGEQHGAGGQQEGAKQMADGDNYDTLVIGSGEAGKYLAWTTAGEGHRTAVVERKLIGGSCPNIACLPSKNIIHSAKVRSLAGRAAEFGVEAEPAATNMKGVQDRKRAMVEGLRRLHLDRYRASGAELIMGEARFTAPRTVDVQLAEAVAAGSAVTGCS
jgi:pyruvate/2-oxoglutarate dehydrogenase complex dihydrolipoamide dehydrogenase (E3) component